MHVAFLPSVDAKGWSEVGYVCTRLAGSSGKFRLP